MDLSVRSGSAIISHPYRSPSFSESAASGYTLRLYCSPARICYAVIDNHSKKLLFLQPVEISPGQNGFSVEKTLQSLKASDPLLSLPFSKKEVAVLTTNFVFLPGEFSQLSVSDAWKKNFTDEDEALLYHDQIPSVKTEIVYSIPRALIYDFDKLLGAYRICHSLSAQAGFVLTSGNRTSFFCHVQPGFMEVLVRQNDDIIFGNIFGYNSPDDFIYYMMSVYHQLHLNPEKIPLTLTGEIVKDSVIFELVYKYIRYIEFGKIPDGITLENDYTYPSHFYFPLLCL